MKRLPVYASVCLVCIGLFLGTLALAEPTALINTAPGSVDASADPASGTSPEPKPNNEPNSTPAAGEPAKKTRAVELNSSNTIHLNYGLREWNTSPTKIDSASIFMREGTTGRIVQIYLEETAPDSSVFSGLYSINWQNIDKMAVEFYVPPQNLLQTNGGMKKILAMINSHELHRHPFILHRLANGQQTVEIFDTREQATTAMQAFHAEQQLMTQGNRKYPSDSDVDTSENAVALRAKQAAAHAAAERVRLEQVEAQRLQKMNEDAQKRTAAETELKRHQAKEAAAAGLALFHEGKFPEAVAKFDEAVNGDPSNNSYYFQYAVVLYKTDQFNKSLVYLDLAKDQSVDPTERDYYKGLNHFKLKEYKAADGDFAKVTAAKQSEMSPSAEFYQGMIAIDSKNWDEGRKHFQDVIDSSKDPVLDKRAETYLDQIVRLQQFEKERSHKWQLSGTLGESFDSNILQSNNDVLDQGVASNSEGYRSLFMGSARYRPLYDEKHEFAVQTDLLTMYSTDTKFAYSRTNHNADPTIATISAPWTYKGLLGQHGYKFDLIPAYESDWMSVEDNTQKQILSSFYVDFNNLVVMTEKWFANYNIEVRKDNSRLIASTGDNDSSAVKIKFTLGSLFMINDAKNKIITTDASYTSNAAQGINEIYDRWDASIGYIQPTYWNMTANAKLSYYYLNYPQATPGRSDNDVTFNLGATKPLSPIYNVGFLAGYTNNSSDVSADQYNRFSILMTFSALYAF